MRNFISGSKFNDSLPGSTGEDWFYGSPGNDTFDGGGGIDTVDYSTLQGKTWPDYTLMSGIEANLDVGRVKKFFVSYATGSTKFFTFTDVLRNIENLVGTGLSDVITGSSGNNMLDGGGGSDTVFAGAGNDNLLGQLGDDVLYGEGGDDRLDGGPDNDTIWGQDGNDTLDGGDGNDQLSGGPSIDMLKGGKGNDTYQFCTMTLSPVPMMLIRRSLPVTLTFCAVSTLLNHSWLALISPVNSSTSVLPCVASFSTIVSVASLRLKRYGLNALMEMSDGWQAAKQTSRRKAEKSPPRNQRGGLARLHEALPIYADLRLGVVNKYRESGGPAESTDSMASVEVVSGSMAADTMIGNSAGNFLVGGGGNDVVQGLGGNDRLEGGFGNDTLDGGADNNKLYGNEDDDILYSGLGINMLDGGAGVDTVDYSRAGLARINANLLTGKVQKFPVAGGNAIVDTVVGIENVVGTAGDDTITGDASANSLSGLGGSDKLDGGAGNDTLDGEDGNDQLSGGLNNDVLKGGKGNDTYFFKRGDAADSIVENDATQGNTDVLQFTDVKSAQLWFSRVDKAGKADKAGSSLQVSILGSTTDKVIMQNWYLGNAYHVEQIKSSDGKTLLDMKTGKGANTDLELLVQAMATFGAAPSAAINTLPHNAKNDALMNALAANWH